jgi:molybdopterin synthase sulfur carrier subunit
MGTVTGDAISRVIETLSMRTPSLGAEGRYKYNWRLNMKVHVRAFASFREILGRDLDLDVKDGSTVGDLLQRLASSHQALGPALFDDDGNLREYVIIMKNRERIDSSERRSVPLADGDEVAILPPVAGG